MKLYGTPPTRAVRAMWLLNEIGVDYEIVPVDIPNGEHRSAKFLALNPAGKAPVLVDGDVVLTESAAMQLYLAEKYPEAGFIPARLADRGQMHRWLYFLMTEIEAPLWRMALHEFIYEPAHRIPEEIPNAQRDCRAMLAVLEGHMAGQTYLVGDAISVADFNAAFTLDWVDEVGLLDEAPNLKAFVERMYPRPKAPVRIRDAG